MANVVLRLPEVLKITGKSKSSIYADAKKGLFPSPINIGARAVGWTESSIESWLEERIEQSRTERGAA